MANKVADTIRELRAISFKMETLRTETRRYLDEKDREMKGMQERINILCNGLVEADATVLTTSSTTGNGVKRAGGFESYKPEIESKKFKSDGSSTARLEFTVSDGFTQVYTDGACPNNGKGAARAGIGVWWGKEHKLNLAQRVAGVKQTNNVAEIQAATMAISQAVGAEISRLQVNTDSQFLINCATMWMQKWKKNGWKTATGQDVKNKDDLVELDKLLMTGTITVKWNHVKGHSDSIGNNEADRLAVKGANLG